MSLIAPLSRPGPPPSPMCGVCGEPSAPEALAETGWAANAALERLAREHPGWRRTDGACPACLQQALLVTLLERGESEFHEGLQRAWPLDAEAAFGAIPTPLRLHADPRLCGRGVTVALVDSAFFPHPDLARPRNRIRAWVDASAPGLRVARFAPDEMPGWPGADAARPAQWHGLMTSTVAAGNGHLSRGLYRGLAPEAEVVLVQVMDERGRIGNEAVARALGWIEAKAADLRVRVVSLSLGGDPVEPLAGNPVDAAVGRLVARGVSVVVAAGNDGERRLVPPATAPEAITVGGLDDRNTLDDRDVALWHSSYGETAFGSRKPEVVAPSLWVVAPVLPGSDVAREAAGLFCRRAAGDPAAEAILLERRLVSPHYQHVEGTSFAAPIVAAIVATMLEANPALSPRRVRELLVRAARRVPGAPAERQGHGAVGAGEATALARADRHGDRADFAGSPVVDDGRVRFLLHEHAAREVRVLGSWDGWSAPGLRARPVEDGIWEAEMPRPGAGRHGYKFLLDGVLWIADPANPARAHDGHGGLNSLLDVR
ncbi:MAG TPA: S8 family serine peptidase [Vicinamibacteria bacterium]|nr:S8 family serine peptidase [Vicinamibacteria bacterium]